MNLFEDLKDTNYKKSNDSCLLYICVQFNVGHQLTDEYRLTLFYSYLNII